MNEPTELTDKEREQTLDDAKRIIDAVGTHGILTMPRTALEALVARLAHEVVRLAERDDDARHDAMERGERSP